MKSYQYIAIVVVSFLALIFFLEYSERQENEKQALKKEIQGYKTLYNDLKIMHDDLLEKDSLMQIQIEYYQYQIQNHTQRIVVRYEGFKKDSVAIYHLPDSVVFGQLSDRLQNGY